MCGGNKDGGRPLYVDGNGNCLFNAISVLHGCCRFTGVVPSDTFILLFGAYSE